MNYLYWIETGAGLRGVKSDDDPLFLDYDALAGPGKGTWGRMSKRLTDYHIGIGVWRLVTNPLEAYAIGLE